MQSLKLLANKFMLILKKSMGEQKKTGQNCIEGCEENGWNPRTSKTKYKAVRKDTRDRETGIVLLKRLLKH